MQEPQPFAVAVMGPTASGKTTLAVALAERLNGEVISVDSAQVYRGLDIGTAKPTAEEKRGIPHHLIDILDPVEAYSTGLFRTQALALLREIKARGRVPILAGGTSLYFHALCHGLADLPEARPDVRRAIDDEAAARGWPSLHTELVRVDPAAAARIHPADRQRIQRALEVYRVTGEALTELCRRRELSPLSHRLIKIVLAPGDRQSLRRRIDQRFRQMLKEGLVEEVRMLHERVDLHPNLPAIRAVGYRQVWAYLEGEVDRDAMVERSIIATCQFAKRQMTWLRRETSALRYLSEAENLLENALDDIRAESESAG
jgi:tRNA dimethylallyltransferase